MQIQRIARWTSTDQLKYYDLTDQEDAFKIELIKRGLLDAKLPEHKKYEPETRFCLYCQTINKFTNVTCFKCNRLLDRQKLAELEHEKEIKALNGFISKPEILDLFKKFIQEEVQKARIANKQVLQ